MCFTAGAAVAQGLQMRKRFDVPAGYRMVVRDSLNIVVKEGYAQSFEGFAIPEIEPDRGAGASHHGRGRLTPLPLGGGSSERALVRRCIRGGILGRFLRGTYLNRGTPRPFEELRISDYARAHDIPTPEVVAAAFERVSPLFYKGALAVREISPAADLQAELLAASRPLDRAALARKRRTASSLGKLVAKMHAAGIYHADLHLKNILLSEKGEGPELYLLDLDAAKIRRPLSDFGRRLNLLRLLRSAEKVNRRARTITRTDLLRFLRSYADESSRSMRELAAELGRMLPVWRCKWKLSDVLGV